MINGVNQNIIFLTMKKILRPFSYKLTNSKTQILLYINITKTSVNLFIVQFVGFFFFSSVRDYPSSRKPSFQAKRRVSIPIYNFKRLLCNIAAAMVATIFFANHSFIEAKVVSLLVSISSGW